MAQDKQAEPKGRNTGGQASFLYSPQQTAKKICFDGATFCRKPPGLIVTTHCLETLYLWRFQPSVALAVTQPSARNRPWHKVGEGGTYCYKIWRGNIVLCVLFRGGTNGESADSQQSLFLPIYRTLPPCFLLKCQRRHLSLSYSRTSLPSQVFTKKKKRRWRLLNFWGI